jgi:hypothetical protein
MIGTQRKRLANWFTHNIDFSITLSGITVVIAAKQLGNYNMELDSLSANVRFWLLFFGIEVLSIGIASLVCYRILLRQNKFSS